MAGVGTVCGGLGGAALRGYLARPTGQPHAVGGSHGSAGEQPPGGPSAQKALELLIEGNRRFASGQPTHPHVSRQWRTGLTKEQHPYAVILGCADSRVAPEVVFDEGLGELFVVRQAGHVADDDTLGSIEYAVGHLHVPLVVVLGHQGCGAVSAAVGAVLRDEPVEGHILRLVDDIAPVVPEGKGATVGVIDQVVRANVEQVVRRLRVCYPVLRSRVHRGELRVVGAYYPLETGVVEWLQI